MSGHSSSKFLTLLPLCSPPAGSVLCHLPDWSSLLRLALPSAVPGWVSSAHTFMLGFPNYPFPGQACSPPEPQPCGTRRPLDRSGWLSRYHLNPMCISFSFSDCLLGSQVDRGFYV